ncbi:Na+/H+ antiporter NhaA [Streptomyces sp. NPDC005438]|uniref:Na+/H+ antiporter NhaA n=1 Tax=Streptomyces sp. NPDC005438 TaxID=3156880 RepID=UPI0033A44138
MPGLIRQLRTEPGAAALLVLVTLIALLWANSPLSETYATVREQSAGFDLGPFGLHMDLQHWINDGLMAVFFFVIGLEVRQEFTHGSLRDNRRARLALIAGIAGVGVPAVVYLGVVGEGAELGGWGVVVGTDTAFMLGALALVGPAMSGQLRVFLLTVTVVDDFLAVSIIGVVYSDEIRLVPLAVALGCLGVLALLGHCRQWRAAPYLVVVAALWCATVSSGIHASLAGMAAGLLVPAYPTERKTVVAARESFRDYWQSPNPHSARIVKRWLARGTSINERLHNVLRLPTALVVVPVFALANAGVDLRGGLLFKALNSQVTWAVVLGLVVGKTLGIGLATYLTTRLGLGRPPEGVGPGSAFGGAALSGIGFTVSLLIVQLAFGADSDLGREATVGVLMAMVLSTLLGWGIFRVAAVRWGETSADLPRTLEPAVDPDVDHIRGSESAPLTLVEYLDYECPFCARATGMWQDMHAHFRDDLRYVVRNLPLEDVHPHSWQAALAAEAAARQGAFWPMHDLLFAHQDALERQDLVRYAEQLGLDMARFTTDLDSDQVAARVRRDATSAALSGARGTPTFFVQGHRHSGPHDARTLIAALEDNRRGTRTQEPSDYAR